MHPATLLAALAAVYVPVLAIPGPNFLAVSRASLDSRRRHALATALGVASGSTLLAALVSKPDVWSKTVLFLTYDENDGFFDHVPPPTAPPGTPGEYLTVSPLPAEARGISGPIGLGMRVPMLVVSPFSRGGYVCSDTFDHTSILRFLETRFGVEAPNLSAWRRSVTGDLTATLDLSAPDTSVPNMPVPPANSARVARECPPNEIITPVPPLALPAVQSMPSQEPGTAKRRVGFSSAC